MDAFSREISLIGKEKYNILKNANVIVFGVGGVGSYVCEALARAGVGRISLVDNDVVSISNINRQLVALNSTIGTLKTTVMKNRILDINPLCEVLEYNTFYLPENADELSLDGYDFVVDCIDTVSGKISLAERCFKNNINLISSMGTGNKLHPEMFEICDISKTSVCPLARTMRKECKDRGIKKLTVLYSKEQPITSGAVDLNGKRVPTSISFVPSVAGLMIAGHVIRTLCGID